jgi:D-beta-D-heptose 7-phosphate kinase / D-beta-D-heptose 1-phosphate adenosyltransferase
VNTSDLIPLVEQLKQTQILCVGDLMLDHYIYGRVERISPEAPVPVIHIEREERTLGGAGNVLRNLHALGVSTCFVSVTGTDTAGREVARMVAGLGGAEAHVLAERGRTTTLKTRYVAGTQQLLRADQEHAAPLPAELRADLVKIVGDALPHYKVTILSDYAKGVLSGGTALEIVAAAKATGSIVVVDPKGHDYGIYRGADVLKPNRPELADATKLPVGTHDEVVKAARALIAAHGFGALLVSCGKDGMLVVESEGEPLKLAAEAREVFDVSGAGDTVVAVLAAALGAGASLGDAARLANAAAGIVVGKVGTAVVESTELEAALLDRDTIEHRKTLPLSLALDQVARWRRNGLTIGFTNGCFDLLHPGHVTLLGQAKAACDRLIVGINSDASVMRLKGPGRPVQNQEARAAVLASLAAVDVVVVFDEDTPEALIAALKPELLVKGADYRLDQVVGADIVKSYGGRVMLAPIVPGFSTTATIARAAR